jgi:tRNA(Arg) A34 adenosine deaminase TadA
MTDADFMEQALNLAVRHVTTGRGGPFAALVVQDGRIVSAGANRVTAQCDPTAHAEVVAIRAACQILSTFHLSGCTLYTTCEPCPMCVGAIYWARLNRVVYAATRQDAAAAGFDDAHFYEQIQKPVDERSLPMEPCLSNEASRPFEAWADRSDRVTY